MKKFIVIAIIFIVILVSLITIGINESRCTVKAVDVKVQSDISNIRDAIDFFKIDNDVLPQSLNVLVGEYMKVGLLKDPWGNDFEYISNGKKYILLSHGDPKDRKPIYYVY